MQILDIQIGDSFAGIARYAECAITGIVDVDIGDRDVLELKEVSSPHVERRT